MDAQATTVDMADIEAAAERLHGQIRRTSFIESPVLNQQFGGRILFKPECLQRTGSFKFRGAYNRISQFTAEERQRGIVAFSSGNHAQGVASSAALFGIKAVIVMPKDAPEAKIASTRAYGAEVVFFDRYTEKRETVAAPFVERGMVLVPPFDDPHIIAGQGTIGLEIVREAAAEGLVIDDLFAPAGGGGLISGVSVAVKAHSPATRIWGAEPEHFDDLRRSLIAGRIVANDAGHRSICDAILTPQPGNLTFPINARNLSGAIAVSDDAVREAMRLAARHLKLVVEPGGSVGLAALASGEVDIKGRTAVVVLSGGNVDLAEYGALLAA
ncbi:threonine/serine dehydratase [Phyllobacterium sp. 0TCS1.6C]|jgi:threonine dehydratase|uniref:threonine ammonia-lyase n=1 Tax=unclassified Phyllobacterium TaxID=2638441 RepID=UPI0022655EB6|nr:MULTISPECIES: threonine/serine dehydratase [unclassified Phyllobacterium]MCX8278633.1 threonine/serine dehydratase [Phyllobacterium sp. 0TCS1.6C]MCX8293537.1 threonine/serine dehydratase [Phyllobacterium sp. 0TCS1.6A]